MAEGSALSEEGAVGTNVPVPAAFKCAGGAIQCPRCFIVGKSVVPSTPTTTISIHACHAPFRSPVTRSGVAGKIPSAPSCGFYPDKVPVDILPLCGSCISNNIDQPAECRTCINGRVRCYEDCDPILATLSPSSPFPTHMGAYCDGATSPSPACPVCSAPNPSNPWTPPPSAHMTSEDGQTFFYLSESRYIILFGILVL
jgi:hypothetical protein